MKLFAKYFFAGLTILALTGVIALGKVKEESVTFTSDVMVGGEMVKAGTYDLRLDEQTGDLEIRKGSKVVAKTSTHAEKRTDKARKTEIRTTTSGGVDQLTSIAFRGHEEDIIVGPSAQSTTGN